MIKLAVCALVPVLVCASCRTSAKTSEAATAASLVDGHSTLEAAWRADQHLAAAIDATIELDSIELTVKAGGRPATLKARRARIQAAASGEADIAARGGVRDSAACRSETRVETERRSERRTSRRFPTAAVVLLAAIGIFCVTLRRKTG